jgi:hypothetical protein
MKTFKSILEDLYTSEYKVKKWVDPTTGKTKERKVRPHRVEFDASKLRGEPNQKDAKGDYGMKEETMNEQATVKTQKYSWGTMKTVHHGASFSIPLHPEHHQAIHALKDQQEHKFKDETGRHWTAKRDGENVHLHSANDGPKTTIKHSDLKEEKEPEGLYSKKRFETDGQRIARLAKEKRQAEKQNEEVDSVEEQLLEVLSKDAKAGEWISDFVKSDNPKFEGKSKKERIKMALGAYYGKQNEELEEGYIVKYHDAKGVHKNTSKVFDDKVKADTHASKGNSIDKVGGKYTVHKIDAEGRSLKEGVNDRPKSTEVKSTTALAPMGKSTSGANIKDSSGVAHSSMSRARRLARLALGKKSTNESKEQYAGLEKEDKKGLPTAIIKKSEKAVEGDTVEGWDHPHDAVKKEEVQKVNIPAYLRKAKGEKPLELKDLKRKDTISDAENLKKATGVKEDKMTYSAFAALLEYEVDKNGKYVHKGTYGSSYAKAEREKDEEGFESEPKAKRGPKMGSKRGARANFGSSKLHTK